MGWGKFIGTAGLFGAYEVFTCFHTNQHLYSIHHLCELPEILNLKVSGLSTEPLKLETFYIIIPALHDCIHQLLCLQCFLFVQ